MLKIMFTLSANRAIGLQFKLHNNVEISMIPGETKAITFENDDESKRGVILNWYRERYTCLGLSVDVPNNTAKLSAERKAQAEAAKKAEEEAKRKADEEAAKKADEEAAKKADEEAAKKADEAAAKKADEAAAKKADEAKSTKASKSSKGDTKNDTVEI